MLCIFSKRVKEKAGKKKKIKIMKRSYELYHSNAAGSGGELLNSNAGLAGDGRQGIEDVLYTKRPTSTSGWRP